MTIADDMATLAADLMSSLGVPATYWPHGSSLPGEAVTVRCKPARRLTTEGRTMWVMEVSVRSAEVPTPEFGDVFEIGAHTWKLSSLPADVDEISEHALGALWLLTLTRDARPVRRT